MYKCWLTCSCITYKGLTLFKEVKLKNCWSIKFSYRDVMCMLGNLIWNMWILGSQWIDWTIAFKGRLNFWKKLLCNKINGIFLYRRTPGFKTSLGVQICLTFHVTAYRITNPLLCHGKVTSFFSSINYEGRPLIAINLNRVLINMSGQRNGLRKLFRTECNKSSAIHKVAECYKVNEFSEAIMGCKRTSYGRKRKLNYSVGKAASESDSLTEK